MDYHLSVHRLKLLNKQLNKQPAIYNFNLFTFHAHAILFYMHKHYYHNHIQYFKQNLLCMKGSIFTQNSKIEFWFFLTLQGWTT